MFDLGELIAHWGYPAILLVVVGGNFGLPVPEETVLVLAGYLSWQGTLDLPAVLTVAFASAVAGDNAGYWIGRRYGRAPFERYGRWVSVTPARLEAVWGFVRRHGALGVFAARFVPGLRFMAGPIAGASGLGLPRFAVANVAGALLYVPYAVGIGYAIGYGLGGYVERVRRIAGDLERVLLVAAILLVVVVLARRAVRAAGARRS